MSRHKHPERIDPLTLSLPLAGVDTHAHLDAPAFADDLEAILQRAKACGLEHVANVFLNPEGFEEERHLFDEHPEVFFLLGVHPDNAQNFTEYTLECIRRHVSENPRIRAIGEIGLDYSRTEPGGAEPEQQKGPFIAQLRLAKELGKPVAIHCRDAVEDTLTILEAEGFAGYKLLWHCFGGDSTLAKRLVDNGWYVSVPGTITYKNNPLAREAVPLIPDDKILLETDCPYLSPVPWRGIRNEPAFTVFTAGEVARCRGVSPETLWRRCGENAKLFYGI